MSCWVDRGLEAMLNKHDAALPTAWTGRKANKWGRMVRCEISILLRINTTWYVLLFAQKAELSYICAGDKAALKGVAKSSPCLFANSTSS